VVSGSAWVPARDGVPEEVAWKPASHESEAGEAAAFGDERSRLRRPCGWIRMCAG